MQQFLLFLWDVLHWWLTRVCHTWSDQIWGCSDCSSISDQCLLHTIYLKEQIFGWTNWNKLIPKMIFIFISFQIKSQSVVAKCAVPLAVWVADSTLHFTGTHVEALLYTELTLLGDNQSPDFWCGHTCKASWTRTRTLAIVSHTLTSFQ